MSDRGMKKWNAYKSLPEHDPAIRNKMNEKYKVERPTISNEEAELINEILVNYHGEEVILTYYRNREINEINCVFKKIDPYSRIVRTSEGNRFNFNEIVGLKRKK